MSTAVESLSEESVVSALGSAFSDEAPKPAAPVAEAAPEEPAPVEAEAPEGDAVEEVVEEVVETVEPEFEIELDGTPEVIRGEEQIKQILQRGIKAQRTHEENARVREALILQAKEQQEFGEFQRVISQDWSKLMSVDEQLAQMDKIDVGTLVREGKWEEAIVHKDQRDKLARYRDQLSQEIQGKHAQFVQQRQTVTGQRARAEEAALLARVPEWRNAEKAAPEKQAIVRDLADHYGFTPEEIGSIVDHRMLLVARDAMKYRALQRTTADKVKQVRTAPPVVKPGVASSKPNPKTEFTKVRAHIRKLGQTGNSRAQEAVALELLNRAFK